MQAEDQARGLQPPPDINLKNLKEERESQTARFITITLLSLLAATFLVQYVVLGLLAYFNRVDAIPHFEHLFNVWLPVLAGLVGTAVGFYLTKERK
jgi:uncharacterized membrane protein YbhN (UPF0104 family)